MRKLTFFATIIALFVGLGVHDVNAQWPQTTTRDTRMSVEVGSKVFDSPGIKSNAPVVADAITGRTLFSQENATDLGNTFGAEVKLNFISRNDREIEVRTILANWKENADFSGPNLASPFFPTGGVTPDEFNYGIVSDYFSIEVMRRRAIMPGVTLMAGPRFVSRKDELTTISTTTVSGVGLSQTNLFEATNALIGLQAGLELNFPVTNAIYFSSFIRAGGYFNPTEFNTSTTNTFTGLTTTTRRQENIESFLGEVGARVSVDLIPNSVSSYVGYEATWIDGIAHSTANAISTGPGIDTTNTSFFHAVAFGVQILY